jgi:hypothetical protein
VGALVVGVGKLSDDRWWVLVDILKTAVVKHLGFFFTSQINHPPKKEVVHSISFHVNTSSNFNMDPSDMEFDPLEIEKVVA